MKRWILCTVAVLCIAAALLGCVKKNVGTPEDNAVVEEDDKKNDNTGEGGRLFGFSGIDILKKIGLQDKKDAMPSALSGGQKQRTAIARALVTRPAIILADEPTGNLDSQTELEVMSLLKSCVSDFGQTLIMITHDETIAQMADEMIIIEDGKAVRR